MNHPHYDHRRRGPSAAPRGGPGHHNELELETQKFKFIVPSIITLNSESSLNVSDQTPMLRTEQRHWQCGRGRRASLAAGASRARGRRSLRALQARVRTMDWNALYPSITGLNFQLNCTAAGRKISGPTQVRVGGRLQRRPGGQA